MNRSISGRASTARGNTTGRKAGTIRASSSTPGSTFPVIATVDVASSSPSSIEPLSPMKTLAGWKLWGRNPTHRPQVMATMSGAMLSGDSSPPSARR